jgi:hypothetical protein
MALPRGAATAALGRVDYVDAGAALGPVVVLAAWALGGLLLLIVVTGNRRRTRPAAIPAEQAPVAPYP